MNSAMFSATAPNLFKSLASVGLDDDEDLVREANRARTQRVNSMPSICQDSAARARAMVFPTEGDGMDAEDMRFHAIRRAVMDRSAKQKKARYRRAQSERGSVSQAMRYAVSEVMKEDEKLFESAEQLAKIIEAFSSEPDDSVAVPYLAWACSQLGVVEAYPNFETRAKAAQRSLSLEEELSLDQMIEDSSPVHKSTPSPAGFFPPALK